MYATYTMEAKKGAIVTATVLESCGFVKAHIEASYCQGGIAYHIDGIDKKILTLGAQMPSMVKDNAKWFQDILDRSKDQIEAEMQILVSKAIEHYAAIEA